jgi:hypothetical protein
MTPRRLLTTIGATALGFALIIGGAATIPHAFAQEATQVVEVPAQTEQVADPDARLAEAYDSFVASLASELHVDEAAVDAAIRIALKDQVAVQQDAGNLDADQAAAIEARIDAADAPLFLGIGGPGGFAGHGRMHGFAGPEDGFKGFGGDHHGPRAGFPGAPGELPAGLTPPVSPSASDAADQSAPLLPVAPTANAGTI